MCISHFYISYSDPFTLRDQKIVAKRATASFSASTLYSYTVFKYNRMGNVSIVGHAACMDQICADLQLPCVKILNMKSRKRLEYCLGSTAEIDVASYWNDLYACSSFLVMS